MSQRLCENVTTDWVNEQLAQGSLVVSITPAPLFTQERSAWHVVLDDPDYSTSAGIVLAFLESINPHMLDEAMAKGVRLSESPGTSALNVLRRLAGGDGP